MWRFSDVLDVRAADGAMRLVVDTAWQDPWLESPDRVDNEPAVITPRFVEQAINHAMDLGWDPTSKVAIHLEYRGGAFSERAA